jgi:hypothetical protein
LRVMKEHHARGFGNCVVEQFEALGAEFGCHACYACQISTAPRESSNGSHE